MSHRCPSAEDLALLAALPAADPDRRAAEACPRCAVLLAELGAFLAGDAAVPPADLADAEARLGAFVSARLVTAAGPAAPRRRRFRAEWGLGGGLALATAAVLAVAVLRPGALPVPTSPSGTVRGGGHLAEATARLEVRSELARVPGYASGTLRLTWPAATNGDSVQVILFTADLDTLAVLAPLVGPPLLLAPEDRREAAYLRVRTLGVTGPVAESPLLPARGY